MGSTPDAYHKGLLLERPTAFTVDEMVPGFDEFSSNTLFRGGEDGGNKVVVLHTHGELDGAREVGLGVFEGGISAARKAVASGAASPGDFKFFFGQFKVTPQDLDGMLGGGGWRAVSLGAATSEAVLRNHETGPGLWTTLQRRLERGI